MSLASIDVRPSGGPQSEELTCGNFGMSALGIKSPPGPGRLSIEASVCNAKIEWERADAISTSSKGTMMNGTDEPSTSIHTSAGGQVGVQRETPLPGKSGGEEAIATEEEEVSFVSSTAVVVAGSLHSSIVVENDGKLSTVYRVGDLVKIIHDDGFGGDLRGAFEASIYEVRGTLLTVRYMGDNKGLYDETIDVLFHHKRLRKHGVLDWSRLSVVGSITKPPPEGSPSSDFAEQEARAEGAMTLALVESCLAVFGRTLPEFDRGYIPRMCRSVRSRMHALVTLDEPDQALAALCHHLDLQLGFSELHFFSVDFSRQRQGLGSLLLERWLALLASSGVHYVVTYASENAISWYEKHGFVHRRDMTLPERSIRGRVTLCTGAKLMELNLQNHPDQRPSMEELRLRLKRLASVVREGQPQQQQRRSVERVDSNLGGVTVTVDGKKGLQIQSVNEEAMLIKVNGNWVHVNYPGFEMHGDDDGIGEVRELGPPFMGGNSDHEIDRKRAAPDGEAFSEGKRRRCARLER